MQLPAPEHHFDALFAHTLHNVQHFYNAEKEKTSQDFESKNQRTDTIHYTPDSVVSWSKEVPASRNNTEAKKSSSKQLHTTSGLQVTKI